MRVKLLNFLADHGFIQRSIELNLDAGTTTVYTWNGKPLLRFKETKIFIKPCCPDFERAIEEEYILVSSKGGFALAGSDEHEDMLYIYSCPWCKTELETHND